jgi:diaminopimelate epimerase
MANTTDLHFTKHHGVGNDFLVQLDVEDRRPLSALEVRALCDRHLGIGADGLIRVIDAPDASEFPGGADLRMELRNADGSLAEMSGNGIRCMVQAAVGAGLASSGVVRVATPAGLRTVEYRDTETPGLGWAEVAMGTPRIGPELTLPELTKALRADGPQSVAESDTQLSATLRGARVDMGNPHLVLVGWQGRPGDVQRLGAIIDRSTPGGSNVEFVWLGDGPDRLRLQVWERGVGETLACGTGAVASAAVCHWWGMVAQSVEVQSPGGTVEVRLGDSEAVLAGPTQVIARCTVSEKLLATLVALDARDQEFAR